MLRWLHLSDFHAGKAPPHQAIAYARLVRECSDLKLRPNAIFLTGDIAQSGRVADYRTFQAQVMEPLRALYPGTPLFCVPGNHDVDAGAGAHVPYSMLSHRENFFLPGEDGTRARRSHVQRLFDYNEFAAVSLGTAQAFQDRSIYREHLSHDSGIAAVIGVCSAWFCEKDKNTKGALFVGIEPLEEEINAAIAEGNSPIFVLMHHPVGHLSDEHLARFENALARGACILVHGHVHQASTRLVVQTLEQSHLQVGAGAAYQGPTEESAIQSGAWRNGFTVGTFDPVGRRVLLEPRQFLPATGQWRMEADAIPGGREVPFESRRAIEVLAPGSRSLPSPEIVEPMWDQRATVPRGQRVNVQVVPAASARPDPSRRKASKFQILLDLAVDIVVFETQTTPADWLPQIKESTDDHQRYVIESKQGLDPIGVVLRAATTAMGLVEMRGYVWALTQIEPTKTGFVVSPAGSDVEIVHHLKSMAQVRRFGPSEIEEFLGKASGMVSGSELASRWAWSPSAGSPGEFSLRLTENRARYWLVRGGGIEGSPDWATAFDSSGNFLRETDPLAADHGASLYVTPAQSDGGEEQQETPAPAPQGEILLEYASRCVQRLDPLQLLGTAVKDALVLPMSLSRAYVQPVLQSWDRLSDSLVTFEEMEEFLDSSGLTGAERERVRAELGNRQAVGRPDGIHDLDTAIQKTGVLLILGEPGAGKTCLLRYRAIQACRRIIEVGADVSDVSVPVVVSLAAFAAKLVSEDTNLHAYLLGSAGYDIASFATVLDKALVEGRGQVFLDGLDEVIDRDLRVRVAKLIDDFATRHMLAGNQVIVTSRLAGYLAGAALRVGHERLVIAPFTDGQVEELARTMIVSRMNAKGVVNAQGSRVEFSVCELSEADVEEVDRRVATFKAGYERHRGLRRLVRNPLLLSILLWMFGTRSELPRQRYEIYEVFTETLLHSRNVTRGEQFRLVPIEREIASIALREIAWWIHSRRSSGLIAWSDLLAVTAGVLLEFDPAASHEAQAKERAAVLLHRIREFGGVFVRRTSDEMWGFSHNTYQEYYAAMYLTGDRQFFIREFGGQLPTARWREVILLALGRLGSDSREAADLVEGISNIATPVEEVLQRPLLFAVDALQELRVCPATTKLRLGESLLRSAFGVAARRSASLRRSVARRLGVLSDLGLLDLISERIRAEIEAGGERAALAIDVLVELDCDSAVLESMASALLVPLNGQHSQAAHAALTALTREEFRVLLLRPDVIALVNGFATHSNRLVREVAIQCLIYGDSDEDRLTSMLVSALNDEYNWVRIWALRGLRDRKAPDDIVLPALRRQLSSLGRAHYRHLMEIVAKLGVAGEVIVGEVIVALRSGDAQGRNTAAQLLGHSLSDSPLIRGELLAAATGDGDDGVRMSALHALRTLWRATGRERSGEGWLARQMLRSGRRDAQAAGLRWASDLGLPKMDVELVTKVEGIADDRVKSAALRAMAGYVGVPAIDDCLLRQLRLRAVQGSMKFVQPLALVAAALRAFEFSPPTGSAETRIAIRKLSRLLNDRVLPEGIRSHLAAVLAVHCGFDPGLHNALLSTVRRSWTSNPDFIRVANAVGDHLRRGVEQGAMTEAWRAAALSSTSTLIELWKKRGGSDALGAVETQGNAVWLTLQDIAEMLDATQDELPHGVKLPPTG